MKAITLFGATGYTGRLVARELAARTPADVPLVLAGRDREKLSAVRDELDRAVELTVADAGDPAALRGLAEQSAVVVSTVGPYARHGTPLVEACVRQGTDYCDLTGEPHWIRSTIDRFHDAARQSGARIVHCCGFDSIPSDLGVWLAWRRLAEQGVRLARATLYVRRMRGGFSGGTVASMLALIELAARDRSVRRVLADPYALNPEGERAGPDGRDRTAARYDAEVDRWTTPFVMAAINTRVVRRTNALLGYAYGRDFRYDECALARGRVPATLAAWGTAAFVAGASFAPTRAVLKRVLPSPGAGPSAAEREAGSFAIEVRGTGEGDDPATVVATVAGERDPGYGMTSIMLAESALCLAAGAGTEGGGILTPAAAMAEPLVARLRRAGMRLEATD